MPESGEPGYKHKFESSDGVWKVLSGGNLGYAAVREKPRRIPLWFLCGLCSCSFNNKSAIRRGWRVSIDAFEWIRAPARRIPGTFGEDTPASQPTPTDSDNGPIRCGHIRLAFGSASLPLSDGSVWWVRKAKHIKVPESALNGVPSATFAADGTALSVRRNYLNVISIAVGLCSFIDSNTLHMSAASHLRWFTPR